LKVDLDLSGLRLSPLDASHDLSDFNSGSPARDTWLRARALSSQDSGDAMTRIAALGGMVIAFYALSTAAVLRSLLPGGLRRNAPNPVPALLIGQLAVDLRHQGHGIAAIMVHDAMHSALRVSRLAGWRLLAVHPDGERAVEFWSKFDFVVVPGVSPSLMALTQTMLRGLLAAAAAAPS
jgi:GNAT superfamily N-acetyltransferase